MIEFDLEIEDIYDVNSGIKVEKDLNKLKIMSEIDYDFSKLKQQKNEV